MGVASVKKAPGKETTSPVATRRSAAKALKSPETPSRPRSARKPVTPRETYTHHLPTASERRSNGRVSGRSLIVWGRKSFHLVLMSSLFFTF